MIPPYGRRHRPVFADPTRFPMTRPPSPLGRMALAGPGPSTHDVMIVPATGLLEIRFGRHRVVTPLCNVAGAEIGPPGAGRRRYGATTDAADGHLVVDTGGPSVVCIRFHRPVRARGADLPPAVRLTVADPASLVGCLGAVPD